MHAVPILNFKFEKEDSAKQNFQLHRRQAIATDIFLKWIAMADKLKLCVFKHLTGVAEVAKRNGN